jgi:hypothetical protein
VPRVCTVCSHRSVKAINAALVGGEAKRDIAKRYRPLTHHALERHADTHIPKLIAKATAADVLHVDEILKQIGNLVQEARDVLKEAKLDRQWPAATGAIATAGRLYELILRTRGDMKDTAPPVQFTVLINWAQLNLSASQQDALGRVLYQATHEAA